MHTDHLKIFASGDTSRIRYIADLILGDILGIRWSVVTDRRKLGKSPVINYSDKNIQGSFQIEPTSLLFSKGCGPVEIDIDEWKSLPIFFRTGGDIPFDVFAAAFFLVTRYEEYRPFKPDQHGRFPSSQSVAFKHGFLDIPVIDLWSAELAKSLLRKFPYLVFRKNEFNSILTVDTDELTSYQGKNLLRSIGGMFQNKANSSSGKPDEVQASGNNPYEVFKYITGIIEKNKLHSRFFFPVGDRSKHDLNPSWKRADYRNLISLISGKYITGLHPSYKAGNDGNLISTEKERLNSIVEKEVTLCRYHYLRVSIPESYKRCIDAGFTEDYSMGYPDEPGFRASIARPFYLYNVIDDTRTGLKIIPFQVMDATLTDYKKMTPAEAKKILEKMINTTRKAGGLFVSIWHNTSLSGTKQWKEWRGVLEFMIKTVNH
jgi:hypothetical protein